MGHEQNHEQDHEPWTKLWTINQGLTLSTTQSSYLLFSQDLAEMQDVYKKHEGDVFGKDVSSSLPDSGYSTPEDSPQHNVKLSPSEVVLTPQSA